ncbi:hypothetical protein D1818_15470 [Aquimarina sp. BL5]|uniref:hypothetical protein n=1 Tax=Aquimarina sp. BL5 TaxID=1714860 RepID=UPI000E546A08|nr:hypothetical protein [Aquimarina sp. BL5]AXT52167.1 hypothetical protein D1818_15470 [Aquimarina sp. BL5]RKN10823.1 hypothetical protein D7036_02135 [Aquimarina sp. BL5]
MKKLKELSFPRLEREQLKKINAGEDTGHWSYFWNENDESGSHQDGGGQTYCYSVQSGNPTRPYSCNACYSNWTDCVER